jgi:hypothetical protein
MPKWSVGQEVLLRTAASEGSRKTTAATVARVGRKWADLDVMCWGKPLRFDMGTKVGEGWYLSFTVHADEADMVAWEAAQEMDRQAEEAWRRFQRRMDQAYRMPPGLTAARITEAERLLFGETK